MRLPGILLAPLVCAGLLFNSWPARADEIAVEPPIKGVAASLQPFIDNQELAGAVTLLANKDQVLELETIGYADLERKDEMKKDTIFWIASMTKPMTAVCLAMLVDEGKLSFEDRVDKYLPEFADQWMVAEETPTTRTLKRPARPITVRDLLTHTAGIADLKQPESHMTLAELCDFYSREPLQFEPGSRWKYSTAGLNVAGRIVEVVSGKRFEKFMQKRLCEPLGMHDTTFWPSQAQAPRVARGYNHNEQTGQLEPASVFYMESASLRDRLRTPKPGGGLFSTATDVARFYQMMLRGGLAEDGQTRLLKEETARMITTTQTPPEILTGFTEGMAWGLGFQVVKKPTGVTAMLHPGTYGHGGAHGTQSWADPERGLIYVLMIARVGLRNGDGSDIRKNFQQAASEAVK